MVQLRDEQSSDRSGVLDVVRSAFPTNTEARLVDLVRDRDHSRIRIVAEDHEDIVGFVLATPLSFDPPVMLNCLAIGPVAVRPDRQNAGIGSQLMRRAIEQAKAIGVDALFLLGHPAYYRRFGFAQTHIGNEYGAADSFMALELTAGCLSGIRAVARYVAEFSEVEA
jgi:putative acetyltransferase